MNGNKNLGFIITKLQTC